MPTIWDLMPASLWPTQRFIPPAEQMQTLLAAQSLQLPRDWASPLSNDGAPWDAAVPPSMPPQELYSATPGRGDNSWSTLGPRSFDVVQGLFGGSPPTTGDAYAREMSGSGGILGPVLGSTTAANIPREVYQTSAKAPFPATQYGVIPKNFPPELRVPPRLSDWQRPESEFDIDSPQTAARVERAAAAGINPNEIILNNPPARMRRETARAADFLFPGSGNYVSGDWNNITGDDVARLAISALSTIGPLAIESIAARAGASAAARAASSARPNPTSVLDDANFAQRWFKPTFGDRGPLRGKTIEEVVNALRSGVIKPSDLEVHYIVRDGNTLILNTRTSQALEQAGVPRSQWKAVNKTGDVDAEGRLSDQLRRNRLTSEGTPTVVPESVFKNQGVEP